MPVCSSAVPVKPEPWTAPALREHPSRLFVETTSRCNLSCDMCMKQNSLGGACEGDLSPLTFDALEVALPHLDALVLNGVGEPLLNSHLENYINKARKLMPACGWIGFQTNGILLNNLRAMSLVDAGLDRVCLSMDGISPTTFSTIRTGGQLQ